MGSGATDDDFDFLLSDGNEPTKKRHSGDSTRGKSVGDTDKGSKTGPSKAGLAGGVSATGGATKKQARSANGRSKAKTLGKALKDEMVPKSKGTRDKLTAGTDSDKQNVKSESRRPEKNSSGDASSLDIWDDTSEDSLNNNRGDAVDSSKSSFDFRIPPASGGSSLSSAIYPLSVDDGTNSQLANPLADALGGFGLNDPSPPASAARAAEWAKDTAREFEQKMQDKMQDGPNPESWHRQDVSSDAVAALNRDRERRLAAALREATPAPLSIVYSRATQTVPAINYVGVGYDSIKGNPIGDPNSMGDPGLRAPIIRFSYAQNEDGVSNDLTVLQPIGGYVRPYVACKQSETVTELSTLSDYQKELSVDGSLQGGDPIGMNSFSASAGYRQFAKEVAKRDTRTYMLKTYCMRYEAGIAQTDQFKWNVTMAFDAAVNQLPTTFDGHDPACDCTPEQWRQDQNSDICSTTNIPNWISFIEQFGTHYLVRLFAGGKMTYQVTMKRSQVDSMKKKGIDVQAQLKVELIGVGVGGSQATSGKRTKSKSEFELSASKETLVIGGRPPGDVSDPAALGVWADTVEQLPMPVKFEVQPLQYMLPADKQDAFQSAVTFYSKAVGMTPQDLSALTGVVRSIPKELTEATQVAWAGPPPGFAKCPEGKVVILGFAMHLNFSDGSPDVFRIVACPPGREKCDGIGTARSQSDEERIYILCADEHINEIQQVAVESTIGTGAVTLEAICPDETVIAGGFALSLQSGREGLETFSIESCTTGQTTCTKSPTPGTQKNLIWMACIDKQYPGIRELVNVAAVGDVGKANKNVPDRDGSVSVACPENTSIVLGYTMEAHTSMQLVRDKFVHCPENAAKCEMSGKGVDKGILWVYDRHALFGWLICKSTAEPASHVATDVKATEDTKKKKKAKKSEGLFDKLNSVKDDQGQTDIVPPLPLPGSELMPSPEPMTTPQLPGVDPADL
ncbi:perforin-like protein PLP1 [Besnoitia besnoiti]|uniref:Perforin-like protein PLP1 n=1 Tax=Besnoitia besnoiti TaxID=94643 RepID=A0A2A9MFQ0_BESBE|nr:perforin-like protein PLP1 [Besnoitia besnoiti]PFH34483.1 perforin-like protein PLP1 [Besnoitia besnoiti]